MEEEDDYWSELRQLALTQVFSFCQRMVARNQGLVGYNLMKQRSPCHPRFNWKLPLTIIVRSWSLAPQICHGISFVMKLETFRIVNIIWWMDVLFFRSSGTVGEQCRFLLACHLDTSEHSIYIVLFQLDPCDCLPPFRHELCTLTEKHEEALMISSWWRWPARRKTSRGRDGWAGVSGWYPIIPCTPEN